MSDVQIINRVLRDSAVLADKQHFTYVNRLCPEFGATTGILLVCKAILSPTKLVNRDISEIKNEFFEATDHDVTGSPLRHSFGEDTFNVTIVTEKKNWTKDEEYHFPLDKFRASTILNLCLEYLGNKWTLPLFVLCDASDKERTILLGAFVESEWFSTVKICTPGLLESSKVHDCSLLMQEHLKLNSVPEREVKVEISSTYEFHGISKSTIDWSENERTNFEGYLSLELSWNSLSFLPPTRIPSNYLVG